MRYFYQADARVYVICILAYIMHRTYMHLCMHVCATQVITYKDMVNTRMHARALVSYGMLCTHTFNNTYIHMHVYT